MINKSPNRLNTTKAITTKAMMKNIAFNYSFFIYWGFFMSNFILYTKKQLKHCQISVLR